MRRTSEKRRQLMHLAKPWRECFVEEIGRCEWGQLCHGGLQVHEISQGPSRAASLMNRACILCLCFECHDILHRMPDKRAVGLAILYHNRPGDYDLREFWRVESRNKPDQREVDNWIRRLTVLGRGKPWEL